MSNILFQRFPFNVNAVVVGLCLLLSIVLASASLASTANEELLEQILVIQADPDYGEYLASECMTCHKAEQSDSNIPVIHGKEDRYLATALLEYKNKQRDNETMRSVAGALGNEEIAALVAYFSQL